ncbi:VanZ family protein [Paludisphaera mucosa]|uniref:VanZ family protein n=1 Tax=Paludisphaera mucosa TaxID=3030827 RepID=A0ABT6F5N4_9BACT|nr:VanZ family protein [Paludisphaera mucosa]MDG3002822.1 VanZ family protein [Paludisphaera mucosa]
MRLWFYAALSWTLLIMVLCWMPRAVVQKAGGETGFRLPNLDKLVHMALFMGFAFLWLMASRNPRRLLLVAAAGLALTVITELGQLSPLVNRDAGLADGTFDMLGVVLGGLAFVWLASRPSHAAALATRREAA